MIIMPQWFFSGTSVLVMIGHPSANWLRPRLARYDRWQLDESLPNPCAWWDRTQECNDATGFERVWSKQTSLLQWSTSWLLSNATSGHLSIWALGISHFVSSVRFCHDIEHIPAIQEKVLKLFLLTQPSNTEVRPVGQHLESIVWQQQSWITINEHTRHDTDDRDKHGISLP